MAVTAVVPGTVAIGDTVRGKFSFDTGTPLVFFSGPADALYVGWNADPLAASLLIDKSGAAINVISRPSISVVDDAAGAYFGSTGDSVRFGFQNPSPLYGGFSLNFYDLTGKALNSRAIPTGLDRNDFSSSSIVFSWSNAELNMSAVIAADATSLTKVSPVPEPGTYAMLLAGIAIIGATSRKRKPIKV